MEEEKAVVILKILRSNGQIEEKDLQVPLTITAYELFIGIVRAYHLAIDIEDTKKSYLRAERPIALLRGKKTLKEYNVMNGTVITIME